MTLFDIFVLALILASVVAGAIRGLVRAVIVVFALIAGLVAAARTYAHAGSFLIGLGVFEDGNAANASGFLLIACLSLALGFAIGSLARAGLRRKKLEWFDRALGASFGFLRGVAVCSTFYLGLTAFPVHLESVSNARTAPVLAESARVLALLTTPEIRERFQHEYTRLFSMLSTSDQDLAN